MNNTDIFLKHIEDMLGEPISEKDKSISQKTIDYLLDNKLEPKTIIQIIDSQGNNTALTHENLPDYLWSDSLLERDTFYYHKELQIKSKISPNSNVFYKEMKIKYTYDDLIKYFCNRLHININYLDMKKTKGAVDYLIKRYSNINKNEPFCNPEVKPIDFILGLIDFNRYEETPIFDLLDIQKNEGKFLIQFERDIRASKMKNKNQIIWR